MAGLLLWEHRLVQADDLSRIDAAFFTMNGYVSVRILCVKLGGGYLLETLRCAEATAGGYSDSRDLLERLGYDMIVP